MDLSDRETVYSLIVSIPKIHLGLGDKMLINGVMREHNLATFDDIWHLINNHLVQFGYESVYLIGLPEKQKKNGLDCANIFEEYKRLNL